MAGGSLKEYDPKQVNITWDGIDLNKGIAAGTFVTVARNTRAWSINVGADGGGTRVRSNDRSGIITVTIRKGSETNALLSDRILDEEKDTPVAHVSALQVKDNSGSTLHKSVDAFLDGPPDDSFSDSEDNLEYNFLCLNLDMDARGNNEA